MKSQLKQENRKMLQSGEIDYYEYTQREKYLDQLGDRYAELN